MGGGRRGGWLRFVTLDTELQILAFGLLPTKLLALYANHIHDLEHVPVLGWAGLKNNVPCTISFLNRKPTSPVVRLS